MTAKIKIIVMSFLISLSANAGVEIDGHHFVTRDEYHKTGRPCACPSDNAKKGKCGGRAALCKNGGYHILDCGKNTIKSIEEYKKVKRDLCGTDF